MTTYLVSVEMKIEVDPSDLQAAALAQKIHGTNDPDKIMSLFSDAKISLDLLASRGVTEGIEALIPGAVVTSGFPLVTELG